MMTEWMRCFVGVAMPTPVRDELGEFAQAVRAQWPPAGLADRVRLVPPENYHLTLKFIGRVSSASVDELAEALQRCRTPAFRLRLGEVGQFPDRGVPKVLFASVGGDLPGLHGLADEVRRQCAAAGFVADSRGGGQVGEEGARFATGHGHGVSANGRRGFRPHVTFARCRFEDLERVPEWPAGLQPAGVSFEVRRVSLFSSVPDGGDGRVYRSLAEVRLPGRLGPGHGLG